jgi:hypothetical protein
VLLPPCRWTVKLVATLQSNMSQLELSAVLMPDVLRTIMMGRGVAELRDMPASQRTSMLNR